MVRNQVRLRVPRCLGSLHFKLGANNALGLHAPNRIRDYVTNWPRTKRRAQWLFAFCVVAVFVGPLFVNYPASFNLFRGKAPQPLTNTLWAAIGSPVLVLFLVWTVIVLLFRR